MNNKPSGYAISALLITIMIALTFVALKIDNDAFNRCTETLSRNQCIRIFG
jgi:hypothetical protein